MEHVRVAMPPEGSDLVAFFTQKLLNREFKRVLDLDVDEFDERAVVYDKDIRDVEELDDGVLVHYRVFWDAYHGCRDVNHAGDVEREVFGEIDGTDWLFPVHEAPEKRSTFEEY